MIDFSEYLGKYVVLVTNDFSSIDQLPGIRNKYERVFKFKGSYVIARPVTTEDLKDEDFTQWLSSIWKHDETKVKSFLRYKHEERLKNPPK